MARIGENILRLRAARGLTAAELAARLNVPEHIVAAWESGGLLPDANAVYALAAALETSPEELLYGEAPREGAAAAEKRRTLSLVLVIMGSLLTAVGLVLLYVYYWNRLPAAAKAAFALLPCAVGAGAGIAVLCLNKKSVPLREGAAVLWCVGVIAANALINSLFKVEFGFEKLLLADLLLLLPVPFLLDSVFAFTLEAGLSVLLIAYNLEEAPLYSLAAGLAALAVCVAYVFCNRRSPAVKKFCAWTGVIALGAAVPFAVARFADMEVGMLGLAMPYVYALALYIAGEERRFGLRLRRPAAVALGLCLLIAVLLTRNDDVGVPAAGAELAVFLVWAALCLAPAVWRGRGTLRGALLQTVFAAVCGAFLIPLAVGGGALRVSAVFFCFAAGVLAVIVGVKQASLSAANLGMLHVAAAIFVLLASMEDVEFIWIGVTFVALGAVFLTANRLMIKKFGARTQARPEADKEGTADEATGN